MVTRNFGGYRALGDDVRVASGALDGFASSLSRSILPALGLHAILSGLGGGLNDATASGRAASSAMYGLQVSMYGVQEAVARALFPAIQAITPLIGGLADAITDADEKTDGWSTRVGLAGLAGYALRRQIRAIGPRVPVAIAGAVAGAELYDAITGTNEGTSYFEENVPGLGPLYGAASRAPVLRHAFPLIDRLPGGVGLIGEISEFVRSRSGSGQEGGVSTPSLSPCPLPLLLLAPCPYPLPRLLPRPSQWAAHPYPLPSQRLPLPQARCPYPLPRLLPRPSQWAAHPYPLPSQRLPLPQARCPYPLPRLLPRPSQWAAHPYPLPSQRLPLPQARCPYPLPSQRLPLPQARCPYPLPSQRLRLFLPQCPMLPRPLPPLAPSPPPRQWPTLRRRA